MGSYIVKIVCALRNSHKRLFRLILTMDKQVLHDTASAAISTVAVASVGSPTLSMETRQHIEPMAADRMTSPVVGQTFSGSMSETVGDLASQPGAVQQMSSHKSTNVGKGLPITTMGLTGLLLVFVTLGALFYCMNRRGDKIAPVGAGPSSPKRKMTDNADTTTGETSCKIKKEENRVSQLYAEMLPIHEKLVGALAHHRDQIKDAHKLTLMADPSSQLITLSFKNHDDGSVWCSYKDKCFKLNEEIYLNRREYIMIFVCRKYYTPYLLDDFELWCTKVCINE